MLGPTALKAIAGLSTAGVCAASTAVVLGDPKPRSAPLHPAIVQVSALTIPDACEQGGASLPARLDAAYARYRAAGTAAARRAVLNGLSATDRTQLSAYIRAQQRGITCRDSADPGTISASVTAGTGQSATSSYVS